MKQQGALFTIVVLMAMIGLGAHAIAFAALTIWSFGEMLWFSLEQGNRGLQQRRVKAVYWATKTACLACSAGAAYMLVSALVTGGVHRARGFRSNGLIMLESNPGWFFVFVGFWALGAAVLLLAFFLVKEKKPAD